MVYLPTTDGEGELNAVTAADAGAGAPLDAFARVDDVRVPFRTE